MARQKNGNSERTSGRNAGLSEDGYRRGAGNFSRSGEITNRNPERIRLLADEPAVAYASYGKRPISASSSVSTSGKHSPGTSAYAKSSSTSSKSTTASRSSASTSKSSSSSARKTASRAGARGKAAGLRARSTRARGRRGRRAVQNPAREIAAIVAMGAILFVALAVYLPLVMDNPQPLGMLGAGLADSLMLNLGVLAYSVPILAIVVWGAVVFPESVVARTSLIWAAIITSFTFLFGGIFGITGEGGRLTTDYMAALVGLFYPFFLAIVFLIIVIIVFKLTIFDPAVAVANAGASAFSGAARWVTDSFRIAFSPGYIDEEWLDEEGLMDPDDVERQRWQDDAEEVGEPAKMQSAITISGPETDIYVDDDSIDDEEEFEGEDADFSEDEFDADGIEIDEYGEDEDDDGLISDEDIEFVVDRDSRQVEFRFKSEEKPYELPPLTLLKDAPFTKNDKADLLHKASIIEKTLVDFKIDGRVAHIQEGPRVTRFEIEIGPGINVSRIHNISDNLALELAVSAVRVEAPIPGKSAVGIEVPNLNAQLVTLKSILESQEARNSKGICTVCLGRDIAGKPIIGNLAKMPHMLVAGVTGSGKSVCLNTILTSILYRADPSELKLVLIDPKWVELAVYKDLPHLITPVVHTKAEIIGTFGWLIKEMERRYQGLQSAGAKNIASYNAVCESDERLPYVIVIVDELADLFMMAGKVAEKQITRIAQKARAVGIHLVVATQRPDVKVITGTIKANIPSRIAFAVAQQVDSRTILDMNGAEKLLGEGDMLYNPIGALKPFRVQGAFVSDEEILNVVEFICAQRDPEFNPDIAKMIRPEDDDDGSGAGGDGREDVDVLYYEAREIVLSDRKCSISWLQRRLRIGYQRSARIVDALVSEGVVVDDPETGSYKIASEF